MDAQAAGGQTPLHRAVINGNLRGAVILIENGAFVSFKDKAGDTPLHLAVKLGDLEFVDLLLNHGIGPF